MSSVSLEMGELRANPFVILTVMNCLLPKVFERNINFHHYVYGTVIYIYILSTFQCTFVKNALDLTMLQLRKKMGYFFFPKKSC